LVGSIHIANCPMLAHFALLVWISPAHRRLINDDEK
jgi:hypothetical protein